MSHPLNLTGSKQSTINHLQSKWDNLCNSIQLFEGFQAEFTQLTSQPPELADILAHEDSVQILLNKMNEVAPTLITNAREVQKKTDKKHRENFFKTRTGNWYNLRSYKRHGGRVEVQTNGTGSGGGSVERIEYTHIDSEHKKTINTVRGIANKIVANDYQTAISQLQKASQERKEWAQKALEASLQDPTIPPPMLITENLPEYLFQSTSYLQENDYNSVLNFGRSWIKQVPQEASWQDVQKMGFVMIEAAREANDVNLTEYRTDLEQWLREHDLLEKPASTPSNLDPATDAFDQMLYLRGLLHLNDRDLSPQALHIYQECSSLYPDQPIWKTTQAVYHMTQFQWAEAEQLLANLPEEDPSVKWAQQQLAEGRLERISSFGLDMFALALPHLVPSSYRSKLAFDAAHTTLQLANGPFRGVWLPRALKMSQPPISFQKLLFSPHSIGPALDIADFVSRHAFSSKPLLQKAETLGSCAVRTMTYAYAAYVNYKNPTSLFSIVPLGSSLISLNRAYDECKETRRSPTVRAMLSTAQKIASDLSMIGKIICYSDILAATRVSQQIGGNTKAGQFVTRAYSSLKENKWFLATLGVGALATYRFYNDYSHAWATCVMEDAEWYCSKNRYDDAGRLLTEAEKDAGSSQAAIQSYRGCLEFFKDYPALIEDSTQREKLFLLLQKLDHAIAMLKPVSDYSRIRDNLLLKSLEVAIKTQDKERLEAALRQSTHPTITTLGVITLLTDALHLSVRDPTGAVDRLDQMAPLFPHFHPVIEKLKGYLQDRPQLFSLMSADPTSLQSKATQWEEAIQELQRFLESNSQKKGIYQDLQYDKLIIAVTLGNRSQIDALFKELEPIFHRKFSYELILTARRLWKEEPGSDVINKLEQIDFSSFIDNDLIKSYRRFLAASEPSTIVLENSARKALEECIEHVKTKEDYFHGTLYSLFCSHKPELCHAYFDNGKYVEANDLLAQEPDLQFHKAVTVRLFKRIDTSLRERLREQALADLTTITQNLKALKHMELFNAFHVYLSYSDSTLFEPSFEALTSFIDQLMPFEELSSVTFDLQHDKFALCLKGNRFEKARELLAQSANSTNLYSKLSKSLSLFLIQKSEYVRQRSNSISQALEELSQGMNFFNFQPLILRNYKEFLFHFENGEKGNELSAYQTALQPLSLVLEQIKSLSSPVPPSLTMVMAIIHRNIAILAEQRGQWAVALTALQAAENLQQQLGISDPSLQPWIVSLQKQLKQRSKRS